MRTRRRFGFVFAVLLLPFVLAEAAEPADTAVGHEDAAATKELRADDMAVWSVDSGGGESSGGGFALTAAIGQPDAGELSAGNTVLAGGLWAGAVELQILFYDGFEGGDTGAWNSAVGGSKWGET